MSSKKNLLIITQKVDQNDSVLGFMHNWIKEFSTGFQKITVICLEKKEYSLSSNVEILSLGKEENADLRGFNPPRRTRGFTRMKYIMCFYKLLWKLRGTYDAVFVHMNPEYVLLGGLFWKLMGKKIVLWYNHSLGDWKTRIAMFFADTICHTSPYAFTAGKQKSLKMPAGIDTELFKNVSPKTVIPSILYIGRITPLKDLKTLIKAVKILDKENIKFSLEIYGGALPKDAWYEKELKEEAKTLIEKGLVAFKGILPNFETPPIFSKSWVFINLTPSGNYDKTVLEAMSCESLSLVSSKAFADILPPNLIFKEKDAIDLAVKIKNIFTSTSFEREKIGKEMRKIVIKNHSLDKLTKEISEIFGISF